MYVFNRYLKNDYFIIIIYTKILYFKKFLKSKYFLIVEKINETIKIFYESIIVFERFIKKRVFLEKIKKKTKISRFKRNRF